MGLIKSCLADTGVLERNVVYNVGTNATNITSLVSGAASITVQDAATLVINIKGSGFTNLALSSAVSMNLTIGGIKDDGTMGATARTNSSSYPTNDVSDYDVVIINGWTLTSVGTITLAFT